MEIKLINTSLSYFRLFTKPVHTTEYNEPVAYDLARYLHKLKLEGESESIVIEFTTNNADLLPVWIQYHFSDEKRKTLSQSVISGMDNLIFKSESHLRFNIERIKNRFIEDKCFGNASFRIDKDETINPNLSHDIEIQDLKIFGSGNELVYRKSGVCQESEKPMIISEYRNLLEWLPLEDKLKLINIGISRGQKYPSQSNPYIVFELNYSEDRPSVKWGDKVGNRTGDDIHKWYTYVTQLIKDMNINNRVYLLLKQELGDELVSK